jgi:hypothetical protein
VWKERGQKKRDGNQPRRKDQMTEKATGFHSAEKYQIRPDTASSTSGIRDCERKAGEIIYPNCRNFLLRLKRERGLYFCHRW